MLSNAGATLDGLGREHEPCQNNDRSCHDSDVASSQHFVR